MSGDATNLGTVVSWRVGGGRRGPDASGRFWRNASAPGPGNLSRGWRTGWIIAGALVLAVALVSAFWLISLLRLPRPARLVLVGAGYEANLQIPHNSYGWRGLQDLAALADQPVSSWIAGACDARYGRSSAPIRLEVEAKDRWGEALKGVPEPTIVVVMALHGGVDAEGAYLLPQDAKALPEAKDRLRMTEVLGLFGSLPRSKKKVLILDATGMPYHRELGMFRNDFALELKKLEPEIKKIPNFVVIGASDEGQRSWTSDVWGRTAFLHFLARALGGEADRSPVRSGQARGARVNLDQVFDYLAIHVRNWAAIHCDAPQEPLILPSGEAGRRLARSIELPSIRALEEPRSPESKASSSMEQAITGAWEDYRKLAASAVQPGVAAPISWRRYEELLCRYQELLVASGRSGEGDYADIVTAIEAQRHQIEQSRTIRLNAARSATLTIPVAEGALGSRGEVLDPAAPAPDVQSWFDKNWWPRADGQESSIWMERKGKEASGDTRNLAAQVGDLVMRQAIADPTGNLDRAARLAKLLDQTPQRPAELNFLVMMQRDLPGNWKATGGDELIKRALRVRRLAERAALGLPEQAAAPDQVLASPVVAAWINAKIAEGDAHRRQAEDLLFASDLGNLVTSAYEQAEPPYLAAILAAEKVRSAILARDRALADLIPITDWLATWYPPADQVVQLASLVTKTEGLWKNVHELGRILETPDFNKINPTTNGADGAGAGTDVEAAAKRVAGAHGRLRTEIDDFLNVCVKTTAVPASTDKAVFERRTIVSALSLPWLAGERRLDMLRRGLESFRAGDHPGISEDTNDVSKASNAVDRQNGDRCVDYRRRLAVAMVGTLDSAANTPAAGQPDLESRTIASLLQRRVEEIKTLVGQPDSPRGPEWAAKLARVDRLVRILDGVSNEQVYSQSGAVDGLRSLRLEDYLMRLASRTRSDLWLDDSGAAVPYFRRVTGECLDDAQQIDKELLDVRRDQIAAIRTGLGQTDQIRLVGPKELIVTSEVRGGFRYAIEADDQPDLRSGQAVTWFQSQGEGFKFEQPANPGRRQAVSLGAAAAGARDITLAFPRVAPGANPPAARSAVLGQAYFRGRTVRMETLVNRYPIPTRRIVRTPPPPGGGVIVSADPSAIGGLGMGAVTIVLDASGSMRPSPGQQGPSKFQEATQALKAVLSQLPPATVVSLWIFGEALGKTKTADVAERTIRRVQKPFAWDPTLLDSLMKEVAAIEPWNESPILRTMIWAAEDLRGVAGSKSLLVLTDGMDNRWATDRQANRDGLDVAASLGSYFAGSDIAVNVIAFRVASAAEQQHVRTQFESVERFHVPGLFATADQGPALIAALDRAMRPALRYAIDSAENGPIPAPSPLGFPVQPAQAGLPGEPQRLPSGGYRLRLLTADARHCRFAINDGDWLLVNILPNPSGTRFDRPLFSREFFGLRPASEDSRSGWRLSVIQNQLVDPATLRMTTTFEKPQDPGDPILQVVRPREIWVDVESPGGEKSPAGMSVTVADQWGYPAPAWRIDVTGWPTIPLTTVPNTPVLQVWWDADGETSPDVRFERGRDFKSVEELERITPSIDGQRVLIESVQIEDHEVDIGDGTKQIRSCLVVRLAYPKGLPVCARPYALGVEGSEHRFYEDVSKYTGLFWPVKPGQLESSPWRLGLISVERFRRDAKRRGSTLRLDKLETPAPRDILRPPIR